MCWLKWDSLDLRNRIISVEESHCPEKGETWKPKDSEARRIDIKQAFVDYLRDERGRQQNAGILSPFILTGSRWKRGELSEEEIANSTTRRRRSRKFTRIQCTSRPLTQEVPQKAFAKMIKAENMDGNITVYSLRHTFATMALRAGVDLRTLQKRMGHSDIKTTMEYLHFIEPEQHPLDKLPY